MAKIIFKGILGNVCGLPVAYTGTGVDAESLRLKAKGYVFNDGIETLRGYAKISDLYKASIKDPYYQRQSEDSASQKHIEGIKDFLIKGKQQAKFLPEIILVARGGYNKARLLMEKGITPTAQGEIDNLDLYSVEVDEKTLFRVDGNHRLEAGKDLNYFVPFAIILWAQSTTAQDDEAFLFYFLNGKAKLLTSEENYTALSNPKSKWSVDEIKNANPLLPYLRQFNDITNTPLFRKSLFKNIPLTHIAHIISDIVEFQKTPDEFSNLIASLNEILPQEQLFPYLKKNFDHILPQLIFYTICQSSSVDEAKGLMKRINDWAKHYNYSEGSFDNPVKLYEVAKKQLDIEEVWVFIAMPFYTDDIVTQYNTSFDNVVNKIKSSNPHLKLNKHKIMTHEGSSIELIRDIIEKIKTCHIFIADITTANPNVMYELGLAKSLDKKIIIVRKEDEKETEAQKVPLDIISQYRETYNPLALSTLEKKVEKHIRAILTNEMGKPLNE